MRRITRRSVLQGAVSLPMTALAVPESAVAVDAGSHAAAADVVDPAAELAPPWVDPEPVTGPPADDATSTRRLESSADPATTVPFSFAYTPFTIHEMSPARRPFRVPAPIGLTDTGVHDSTGVRMIRVRGVLHNHPVAQAQYGLALLDSHRLSGDTRYLNRAVLQAARIIRRRTVVGSGWWYPYDYPMTLHGRFTTLRAPWYSMMAQGLALSLFVRLYQVTGLVNWLNAANATFATYLQPPVAGRPWGVYVVNNRLWLEEYPYTSAFAGDRTYNGHNFSAYGLCDYWAQTKNARALLLIQGAFTTSRDVVMSLRVRGWRSHYCLAHGVDSGHYHDTHITQNSMIERMTHDLSFAQHTDLLNADFPLSSGRGTVRFMAGSHRGYRFNSVGTILASKTISLAGQSWANCSARDKVLNRAGTWYVMSNGALAGYRVAETAGVRFRLGSYCTLGYTVARRGVVLASGIRAYQVDAAGTMTSVTTSYGKGDAVHVNGQSMINGVAHWRLADGPYAGRWVSLRALQVT